MDLLYIYIGILILSIPGTWWFKKNFPHPRYNFWEEYLSLVITMTGFFIFLKVVGL